MKENFTQVRSEEVQDIISRMPGWTISYGASLIFGLLIFFLGATWFIKYPDVIKADVVITTNPPPIVMVARASGNLILQKAEDDNVGAGELIGHIQTTGKVEDVLALEKALTSFSESNFKFLLERIYEVGELQNSLNQLVTSAEELLLFNNGVFELQQIESLGKQLYNLNLLSSNLRDQVSMMTKESLLATERFKVDSTLHEQKVIPKLEFLAARNTYLQQQRNFKAMEATLISNQQQIGLIEGQITDLEIERLRNSNRLRNTFLNSKMELQAAINKWKETWLLISPIEGKLAYITFLEDKQFVNASDKLFSVIPTVNNIYGRAELPVAGSGKVKEGQKVNIRLSNYPHEQFGMLSGTIESISLLPTEDKYFVNIDMPKGMISSYNQALPFRQQLQGETEVITEDLRLPERVFYQFRKLLRFD